MEFNVVEIDGMFSICYQKSFLGIKIKFYLKSDDGLKLTFDSRRKAQAYINFQKNPKLKK